MKKLVLLLISGMALTACAQQEIEPEAVVEPAPQVQEDPQPTPMSLQQVIEISDKAISCSEPERVIEGEFETFVCDQGIIRIWDEQLPAEAFGPWPIWCQPALAATDEPEFEVVYGLNFIIENHNTEFPGLNEHPEVENLCIDISELPYQPAEADYSTTFGFLTGLADAGLCFEPAEITPGEPTSFVCSGFGAGEQSFELWLETGDVSNLSEIYAAECGAGITGTYGEDWIMTSFDGELIVGQQSLAELITLASPVPFSDLCGEQVG